MEGSIKIDEEVIEAAVLGGAVLGGGGGGWIDAGMKMARRAMECGFSEILPINAITPDALLLQVSLVGAPSVGSQTLTIEDYIKAVSFFIEVTGLKIDGLISNELGAVGVVNGWIQSPALNIPVIDAPGNGRAHPTGLMGSMGLHRIKDYESIQTAIGGDARKGTRVEAFFRGSIERVSRLVREVAINVDGMVAVARNPVKAEYVRKNGAPGAIAMAIEVGKSWTRNKGASAEHIVKEVLNTLGGSVIIRATVESVNRRTSDGFDVGTVSIREDKKLYELTFWNEYITLASQGRRLATFPDLIMTFDANTSMPVISTEIKEDQEILLITVPAKQLILGTGVKDKNLLKEIETVIGREIL
ncbi:DUF917 family protein [Candidatus Sumerlaeota bacterium]|nr:DUF917 family protein [Candidatus Sumerlaeota bacterium]